MLSSRHLSGALALVAAVSALLSACESNGEKAKSSAKTLDRQGVQTVAVLAHYLFPRNWDEGLQVAMARRMYPLEYHGNEYQGNVLIQSKVEFDAGALQRLLVDAKKVAPTFEADAKHGAMFGQEADRGDDDGGGLRPLSWWKPGRHKDAVHYHWTTQWPGEPKSRIWLQISDAGKGKGLVYIRIESD